MERCGKMKHQGEFLQFLQEKKRLSAKEAAMCLEIKQHSEQHLADILHERQILTHEEFEDYLSQFFQMPLAKQLAEELDESYFFRLPRTLLLRYGILPFKQEDDVLCIAISQKPQQELLEDLSLFSHWSVRFYYAEETMIEEFILMLLSKQYAQDSPETAMERVYDIAQQEQDDHEAAELVLYLILQKAIEQNASDIHLEIFDTIFRIRLRIDGFLHNFWQLPKAMHSALVNIIKIKSNLDIAQRREPQDGHFRIKWQERLLDLRVATLPCLYGEKVVLRILGAKPELLSLESLGFSDENLQQIKKMLQTPYGLILITGPTNSGKSTTLYSMLHTLLGQGKNIMTIEDPVEYELLGINQIQVNNRSGLTFAKGLRGILRQDPDIIMIGELRDTETAAIAVRAANTGHLVLASLHTNDAFSAVLRLLEMGTEPFLLNSCLLGVIGQRLVRKNCECCLITEKISINNKEIIAKRGSGCPNCHDLGYKGRLAVQEVWLPSETQRQALLNGQIVADIRRQALREGYCDIYHDGLAKIAQGLTTLEEIMMIKFS